MPDSPIRRRAAPIAARVAAAAVLMLGVAGCARLLGGPEVPRYVIFFQPFSANLDDTARGAIAAAAAAAAPTGIVYVSGYAAADQSAQANKHLSAARAHVVADALREDGVDPSRLKPKGEGPVDVALDPVEARRVEISVGAP